MIDWCLTPILAVFQPYRSVQYSMYNVMIYSYSNKYIAHRSKSSRLYMCIVKIYIINKLYAILNDIKFRSRSS